MIKLITIDLDGTLFDKEKNISKENIEAIKKARKKGAHVVIATGRPTNGIKGVLKTLDLIDQDEYLICYNGAKIINIKTNEVIFSTHVTGADTKKLYQESLRHNVHIHAFRDNEELITTVQNPYTDVEVRINKIEAHEFDFNQIKDDDNFIKVMLVDELEKLNSVEKEIDPYFPNNYSMVRSAKIFLEFLNKSSDKGHALVELARHLGISMEETMAIGDAGNDLHMIEVAKIGVAMSNSFNDVLEAADYVTLSNEESGVAHAINKFVLND